MFQFINRRNTLAEENYHKICDGLLLAGAVICIPVLFASVFRAVSIGWQPVMLVQIGLVCTFWLVTGFRKHLPYNLRAGFLVAFVYAVSISGIWQFGLLAASIPWLAVGPFLATIFLGVRAGILTGLFTVISAAVLGFLTVVQNRLPAVDSAALMTNTQHWVAFIISVMTVIALMVLVQWLSHGQLVRALRVADTWRLQLEQALDSMNEGFALFDAEDRLVVFNGTYREMYKTHAHAIKIGATMESILRAGLDNGAFPRALGREEEWLKERLNKHQSSAGSVEQQLIDGRWLLIDEYPTAEGGRVGVRVDITRQKRMEASLAQAKEDAEKANVKLEERVADRTRELRNSEKRLTAHVENTPLGVVAWNKDFQCTLWNPAAVEIFGFSKDEALGQRALDLIVPEALHGQINNIFQTLMSGDGGRHSINPNKTKDGRTILCEWYNTPLVDEDGSPLGVASVVRDITEQDRLVNELADERKSLGLLHHIAEAVRETNTVLETYQICLRLVGEHMGWPAGHVYVPSNDNSDMLTPLSVWHIEDDNLFAAFRELTERTVFKHGEGLPGRVLKTGKPAWIKDLSKDANYPPPSCWS